MASGRCDDPSVIGLRCSLCSKVYPVRGEGAPDYVCPLHPDGAGVLDLVLDYKLVKL